MRKLSYLAGLSMMVLGALSLPQIVSAKEVALEISPESQSLEYGIVRNSANNTVEISTLAGERKSYLMSDQFKMPSGLKSGDLVGYDVNKNGTLMHLQQPTIADIFEGKITDIKGDKITLTAADGTSLTTTVARRTIDKLQFCTGQGISLTQYQGTWATKVCCIPEQIAKSPLTPPSVIPPPPEFKTLSNEFSTEVVLPIPALW